MIRAGTSIEATAKPVVPLRRTGLTALFPRGCHPKKTGSVLTVRLSFSRLLTRRSPYSFAAMEYPLTRSAGAWLRVLSVLGGVAAASVIAGAVACSPRTGADMSASEKKAIADSLKQLVVSAYDLSKSDPVKNLMSLYPTEGRVISASGGVMTTTRPQLEQGIKAFWTYVGQNMRQPRWEWTSMNVDVLAPDAAVMTSTYRVPHLTPMGMPHVIGGAWTAVFQKRGGRWVVIQEHLSDVQNNPNIQMNMNPQPKP